MCWHFNFIPQGLIFHLLGIICLQQKFQLLIQHESNHVNLVMDEFSQNGPFWLKISKLIITCNENACLMFYSFASCVGVYHSITCPTTLYPCSNHRLEIPGFRRVDIFSGWKPLEFRALNVRIDQTIVIWANNYISTNVFSNSSKRMNGL